MHLDDFSVYFLTAGSERKAYLAIPKQIKTEKFSQLKEKKTKKKAYYLKNLKRPFCFIIYMF